MGLINDILELSQMEAGKLSIRPSLFELRPLLDSCAGMFAEQAAERGITIRVGIAAGTPETLLSDPARLRQVQLNLLSNALKDAHPGVVWLTAEPGDGAHQPIRLTVKDNGPVIAPDARARLFRPFSQLDRPEGDDPAGTGLGLSICLQLVTLMGGAIGCDTWRSEDGRDGNAFWITLPATALPLRTAPWPAAAATGRDTDTDQAGAGEAAAGHAGPGQEGAGQEGAGQEGAGQEGAGQEGTGHDGAPLAGSLTGIARLPRRSPPRTRVLLTESIAANQIVTATLLRREGHHVDIAPSGPAAIQAVQAAPYDLVFMDIVLPGMGGQEATQAIRTLPEPARSTPIIALAANVGPRQETICRTAGMDGLLAKPMSPAELLGALDRHVWSAHASAASPTAAASPAAGTGGPAPSTPKRTDNAPILAAGRIDELRASLPPETFASLVEECLVDMDHRLPALRRALAAGAPGAVAAHAHALVGIAGSYGMAALEMRLRAIMAAARRGDLTPLEPTIVAALETDFAESARALREMLRKQVV